MTPRQPFNESGIPVSEAGANFGGQLNVREMRETCACASPLTARGAFVVKSRCLIISTGGCETYLWKSAKPFT